MAHLNEVELYKVLKYYGEEKNARKIARALVEARCLFRCPRTTMELADLVAEVVGSDVRQDKLQRFAHPATKTFQVKSSVGFGENTSHVGGHLLHIYIYCTVYC